MEVKVCMSSFGQRLKFLREEKGDNQKKIAKMLGLSRTAISKYENDEREPDIKTILALTNYFDVTVDYLFGKTIFRGHPHYIPENLRIIVEDKPIEQVQEEIKSTTGVNLELEELNSYLSGKQTPTIETLVAFANYAQVNIDFFYRKNNQYSFKKEQEDSKISDKSITLEIAEEIIINNSFVKLALWVKEHNLSPEKIINILENILSLKDE